MRRNWPVVLLFIAGLAAGCRPNALAKLGEGLSFSSPDQPAAVAQPDAGVVDLDFGQVGLGATKTLVLQLVSTGDPIVLGAISPLQADAEFNLPLVPGTTVGSVPPVQITAAFTPSSLGQKTAIYALATDANSLAAVTLTLTGQGVPQGLVVTPDPVDFRVVELNQVQTLAVTIGNQAEVAATLDLSPLAGADPALFSLDPLPSTNLAAGDAETIQARFAPLQAGEASAWFTLSACPGCGTLTVPLEGVGAESVLQISPDPLHFGFVAPGTSATASLAIANLGNQSIDLEAPGPQLGANSPAIFSLASPDAGTPTSYPDTLAAGQSAVIPIAFAPPRIGFFGSSLSFSSSDPGAPAVTVAIDGYGGGAKIACLPAAVSFGPVAVANAVSQPVICSNVGSDVPNHPEAALQISLGGLETGSLLFTAAVKASQAGGLGDGGLVLTAGQSVEIDVTYTPSAAESDSATLTVPSNDTLSPRLAIALSGQGIVPGSCSYTVAPGQLSFGEVPAGGSGEALFQITDTGQTYCLISDLQLAPGSDPAFSLPTPLSNGLLGFAGNPGQAPTSLRLPVQFAPVSSETAAAGEVTFAVSGAAPGAISLAGSSAPACLAIDPPSHDFGLVGFDPASGSACVFGSASFSAQNVCPFPVTVSALGISSGLDAAPQFALNPGLALPSTIPPAGQITFGATFEPTSIGLKGGAIALTSDEPGATRYQISLLGDAESTGQRTDAFMAQNNKVDLVFILDNDDDLAQMVRVSQELPGFLEAADAAQIDYRIAVTSTDTCDVGPSDQGSFEPCDHCTSQVASDPLYLTPQTANAAQLLSDLFLIHDGSLCKQAIGDELFFDAIDGTFDPALLSGHNSGFLRDDAYLAVVLINGDSEDDRDGQPLQGTVDVLQGLKADAGQVSLSYIAYQIGTATQNYRMTSLVEATGGIELDTGTQWVPEFFSLFWADQRLAGFQLSTTPDPSSLVVEENGVPFAAEIGGSLIWTYNAASNSVVFSPQALPVPGTVITVSYALSCD